MRKVITTVLTAGLLLIAVPATAQQPRGWDQCRLNKRGENFNNQEVKRTIRCAVDHWNVPGGYRFALCIAAHESGFQEGAFNPNGHAGVYQQSTRYWPGRQNAADRKHYPIQERVLNARANIIVSIKMAHGGGWDDWTTASSC